MEIEVHAYLHSQAWEIDLIDVDLIKTRGGGYVFLKTEFVAPT